MTDSLAMARGDRTDLKSLALKNRAAAQILNVRGTVVRTIAPAAHDGSGKIKKKAFPLLLRAAQILMVAACIWVADRVVLDSRLSDSLGSTLQVGSLDLRIMAQKLIYRAGL